MQLLHLSALLLSAGLVSAQSLAGLPTCATSCVGNSIPASCNLSPACICKSTSFIEAISCCVSKSCDKQDQEATLQYAKKICTPAGVTNLPSSAGCSGAATASGTASGASSTGSAASSASSSASSALSSLAASASSMSSSMASSMSSAASSASSAASSMASSASSVASSSASAASASASSAAGRQLVAQGAGAIGAGLLGVAAML